MDYIKDKVILLFCGNFYRYDTVIRNMLYQLGAKKVILKNNIIFNSSFRDNRRPSLLFHCISSPFSRTTWTRKLIDELEFDTIDVLFCIQYTPFKKNFISYLKNKNTNFKSFIFLWDSISDINTYNDYYKLFDYRYSFDKKDVESLKDFSYLPDFYLEDKDEGEVLEKYDICFIGSLNLKGSKRLELLYKIKKFCTDNNLENFLYLRCYPANTKSGGMMRIFYNSLFNKRSQNLNAKMVQYLEKGFVKYESLPLQEVNRIQNLSKCIVDINYGKRYGYTLNVISAIAKGKKLITTNFHIKDEPFYNANNICIIDENNPCLDVDFFSKPNLPVDITYLRLDNWLKTILTQDK